MAGSPSEARLDPFDPDFPTVLVVIVASIVGLGAFSLRWMRLLAAGWALCSLFTRVDAIGLLAAQLACTALAYLIGERFNRLTHAFGRGFSPDKVRIELYKIGRTRRTAKLGVLFVLGVAAAFAWLAAPASGIGAPPAWWQAFVTSMTGSPASQARQPDEAAAVKAAGRTKRGAASTTTQGAPVAATAAATATTAMHGGAAAQRSLPTAPDIRHCLAEGSPEAIVACAEKTGQAEKAEKGDKAEKRDKADGT